MFISTLNTDDQEVIARHLYQSPNSGEVNSFYKSAVPFQMYIQTVRPDSEDTFFILSVMAPDFILQAPVSRNEFSKSRSGQLHHHDFFEMMVVLEGEVYQNIENLRHLYTAGSCCLLNKKTRHTEEYSSEYRAVFLSFSDELMRKLYQNLSMDFFTVEKSGPGTKLEAFFAGTLEGDPHTGRSYLDFIPRQNRVSTAAKVHKLLDSAAAQLLAPKNGSSFIILEKLTELFLYLNDPEVYDTTPVRIGTDTESRLFDQISAIIEKNEGIVSRKELAHELHYSGIYLNNIVKKYTSLTIHDYAMVFRMKCSARLLESGLYSVTEVADRMGFSNKTSFYKAFRDAYQVSPLTYKNSKIKAPLSL